MRNTQKQTNSEKIRKIVAPVAGIGTAVGVTLGAAKWIEERADKKAIREFEDKIQIIRADQRNNGEADSTNVLIVKKSKLYDANKDEVMIFGNDTHVEIASYEALIDVNDKAIAARKNDNITSESLSAAAGWGLTAGIAVWAAINYGHKVFGVFKDNKAEVEAVDTNQPTQQGPQTPTTTPPPVQANYTI
jgi:hypothetical protein